MWAEPWLDKMPRALRSVWASALGTVPLDVWWANGERERTYAVASWLPGVTGQIALCWYAALDPEPGSEQVRRAVTRAFRGVSERVRRWLVGMMPLGTPELIKLAGSRRNDFAANQMLRARQRAELTRISEGNDDEERPLRLAWYAATRLEDLTPAWQAATEPGSSSWLPLQQLMILPTRDARAWRALPAGLREPYRAQAAYVAALSSVEEAEQVLARAGKEIEPYCRAALARPDVPGGWAERILAIEDPTNAYLEGLYTSDERWTILIGRAACDRDRGTQLDAVLVRMMVEAQAASESWAGDVKRRMLGQRDEAEIAKLVGLAGKALAAPSPKEFRIMRQLRALAAAGGRREAAPIVEELERRELKTFGAAVYAEGRSLSLLADEPEPQADLIAALAADGHLDEVRKHLPRLLSSKPSAETLLDLARAIVLLEPDSAEVLRAGLGAALEQLPGSSESEARAWLSGSPDY